MNRINYDQEKIIELYNKGYTDRQIAETLNYPVNNFASYIGCFYNTIYTVYY